MKSPMPAMSRSRTTISLTSRSAVPSGRAMSTLATVGRLLLRLLHLDLRPRLTHLHLGLGHGDVHVGTGHAHDDLGLSLVHRHLRLRLTHYHPWVGRIDPDRRRGLLNEDP